MPIWNQDFFDMAVAALRQSGSLPDACRKLAEQTGKTISPGALSKAFAHYQANASDYLDQDLEAQAHADQARKAGAVARAIQRRDLPVLPTAGARAVGISQPPQQKASVAPSTPALDATAQHLEIVRLLQKGKGSVEAVADALNCAPKEARRRLEEAAKAGYDVGTNLPAYRSAKTPISSASGNESTIASMDLVQAVQRGDKTVSELANHFGVSPQTIRQAIETAQNQGYGILLDQDQVVHFVPADVAITADAKEMADIPTADGTFCFGAVSDTHFGSKYCDEEAFKQYVDYAYSVGVRTIVHAGDLMTGLLNHYGMSYDVKVLGFDNQVELTLSILPQKPGLSFWFLCGNHEQNSWAKAIGGSPGRAFERRAREVGRTDIHHVGDIQGRVVFGQGEQAVKVELAHPKVSGNTYAISYPVQKWVERMPGGAKPHILISGHAHVFSMLDVRNVICVQPGCFEHSTPFTRELGLHPAVGGVIIWARRDGLNLWFRSEWVATRTKPVDWTQIE